MVRLVDGWLVAALTAAAVGFAACGSGDEDTTQAKIAGPGFDEDGIVNAVERTVEHYRAVREPNERFIDTYRRVGMDGFKEAIYG